MGSERQPRTLHKSGLKISRLSRCSEPNLLQILEVRTTLSLPRLGERYEDLIKLIFCR